MQVLRRWRLLGALVLFVPPVLQSLRWALQVAGDIDFVVTRAREPGWVGDVVNWLTNPPGWVHLPLIAGGLALVYFDMRRAHDERRELAEASLQLTLGGAILTVTAKSLLGLIGATRHALGFRWDTGAKGSFGEITGHHVSLYAHDFDGDGANELIVRYHAGGHTHVMQVYKINPPPAAPALIPGAEIGSDASSITWRERRNGAGVIVEAANEGPAKTPVITRYIFENGRCVALPPDRVIDD